MPIHFVILPSDFLLFLLIIISIILAMWFARREDLRMAWQRVLQSRIAVISMAILVFYLAIGLLDSIHFYQINTNETNQRTSTTNIQSVLDVLIAPAGNNDEKTYSAPFATHLFSKETVVLANGMQSQIYPSLEYAGLYQGSYFHLAFNIISDAIVATTLLVALLFIFVRLFFRLYYYLLRIKKPKTFHKKARKTFWMTLAILVFIGFLCDHTTAYFHIFGTDKIGQDVFYMAIKSVRTGLILGTITTLIMLPFAIFLGTMAGYFGGIVDDIIQYIYTTLSSIPGVLLIAASILALQIFISNHENFFSTIAARSDARLLALCLILGITSWTSLCRLLRGEALKLREMDYVMAARALGVGHFKIITRHIIPNIMHIILITMVLDFSGLVLAEAVLTYVGVGVDPTTMSWGNMINSARLELARDPVVWWPLIAAFILMFILVLATNLFADIVREAFDPRLKSIE